MILYLVRHGESTFNAEGRIQGQLDTPLSSLGRRQATAVAEHFRGKRIDAIYTSPLSRARQTAEPIGVALELNLQTDSRLMEINAGVFQGLVWSEISERYPEAAVAWKSHTPTFRIPQGESRADLMARAEEVLREIRATDHDQAIVVAHGGLITAGLKVLLGVPAERNPFMLYNGSISLVDWTAQFRLVTLNQMEHLHVQGIDLISRTGEL
jgi:broad specificity phosphatase PhoE